MGRGKQGLTSRSAHPCRVLPSSIHRRTKPPAASMRAFSSGFSGLWSSVKSNPWMTPSCRWPRRHRESPRLATFTVYVPSSTLPKTTKVRDGQTERVKKQSERVKGQETYGNTITHTHVLPEPSRPRYLEYRKMGSVWCSRCITAQCGREAVCATEVSIRT